MASIMTEWTLGIADAPPRTWKIHEPLWHDERLTASSSHSFLAVMSKLCDTAIRQRREFDHGVNEHLWHMKITSEKEAIRPRNPHINDDSDDDSKDDDTEEAVHRNVIQISCPSAETSGHDVAFLGPAQKVPCRSKLRPELLPQGSILTVTYDYGTTTTLYLKVLSVTKSRAGAATTRLEYFTLEPSDVHEMTKAFQSVPAYHLPKDQRVDNFFPNASRAFLGYYLPLFTKQKEDSQHDDHDDDTMSPPHDGGIDEKVMGCTIMGCFHRSSFCAMENRTRSQDLLYSPYKFDPTELLQVIEKAWEPRDRKSDEDDLSRYRYDSICRLVVPAHDDEAYKEATSMRQKSRLCGPVCLVVRLNDDRKASAFDFSKVFPKTYAMLRSGKHRWFQYKKGVLRVLMGRGKGHDRRQFESIQVLKTWKHDLESFHDLLCLVEASWVWNGRELNVEDFIDGIDDDVDPIPVDAPTFVAEKDCSILSSCMQLEKLVTCLAMTDDPDGRAVLYSGHDDGTLTKWFLEDDTEIWTEQLYPNDLPSDRSTQYCGLYVNDTTGVAGIAIRPDPRKKKHHLIYTWSNCFEGNPKTEQEFERRNPSSVKAWAGEDGKLVKVYRCDIGLDAGGKNAHPVISTVVFCKLFLEDQSAWVDSMIVGLHCIPPNIRYHSDFSDFDIDEAQEIAEGNILPFQEHSKNGIAMESWRGDSAVICAMAVIESTYLLTHSVCWGSGLPHSFILWSLQEPGIPLLRKELCLESKPFPKKFPTRIDSVSGISVDGDQVLLAHDCSDGIVALQICEEEDDEGSYPIDIDICGYGKIGIRRHEDSGFHGRMAMSQRHIAIVANEICPEVWIFNIAACATHEKLDRREGNIQSDDKDHNDWNDEEVYYNNRPGRQIAVGKVEFPPWGGNPPKREKAKPQDIFDRNRISIKGGKDDGFGRKGGPLAIAIRGKWIISGFSNGTLSKALLPEELEEAPSSVSSNHLASCSYLKSDEFYTPELKYYYDESGEEMTEDDDDDDDFD